MARGTFDRLGSQAGIIGVGFAGETISNPFTPRRPKTAEEIEVENQLGWAALEQGLRG